MTEYEIPADLIEMYHRPQLKDAYDKYYRQLQQQRVVLHCQLGIAPKYVQNEYNYIQELKQKVNEQNGRKDSDLVFITIAPRHDVLFKDFKKIISIILNKKWLDNYIQVYEQRGETPDDSGKHYHAHILLRRSGKKFSEIRREISNTVKNILQLDVDQGKFLTGPLQIKLITDSDTDYTKIINYLTGVKKDVYKHPSQKIDELFREQHSLQPYYVCGTFVNSILSSSQSCDSHTLQLHI